MKKQELKEKIIKEIESLDMKKLKIVWHNVSNLV
jgi:hypothetical protein